MVRKNKGDKENNTFVPRDGASRTVKKKHYCCWPGRCRGFPPLVFLRSSSFRVSHTLTIIPTLSPSRINTHTHTRRTLFSDSLPFSCANLMRKCTRGETAGVHTHTFAGPYLLTNRFFILQIVSLLIFLPISAKYIYNNIARDAYPLTHSSTRCPFLYICTFGRTTPEEERQTNRALNHSRSRSYIRD